MKAVPNGLSIIRIILSLILIVVSPFSAAFYVIYFGCGLSDTLDGFIARKTGAASKLGAKLDSAADIIMVGVLLVLLYPIVNPAVPILTWIISIGIIRLASIVVTLIKYKTFGIPHTYGNKITGFFLFLFPILLPYIHAAVLMYIICTVASLSAIEELLIQLTSSQLQLNKQSIFVK